MQVRIERKEWLESSLTEYWKATGSVILLPTIQRGSKNTCRFISHTPVREEDSQVGMDG